MRAELVLKPLFAVKLSASLLSLSGGGAYFPDITAREFRYDATELTDYH